MSALLNRVTRTGPVRMPATPDNRMACNDEPEPLSETAMQIGRESVLSAKGLFSAWLDFQEDVREPSAYFGNVSTWELVQIALFNNDATDEQRKATGEEVKRRYLEQESESVIAAAREAAAA